MQQGECLVAGLLDSSHSHEAESTIKRLTLWPVFFKYIAEGPERQHVDQAIALADIIRERGADVDRIAGVEKSKRWDVPFGPEKRQLWTRRGGDLIVNLADGRADSLVHWDLLIGSEEVFHGVVGVSVAGDEIDGDVLLGNVLEK